MKRALFHFQARLAVGSLRPDQRGYGKMPGRGGKSVPQRLKPSSALLFTARLKPCPSWDCLFHEALSVLSKSHNRKNLICLRDSISSCSLAFSKGTLGQPSLRQGHFMRDPLSHT